MRIPAGYANIGGLITFCLVSGCASFPGHNLQSRTLPSQDFLKQHPVHFQVVDVKDKIHRSNETDDASAQAFKRAVCASLDRFESQTNTTGPCLRISLEARGGSLAGTLWSTLAGDTLCLLPSHTRETYRLRAELVSNGQIVKEYHYMEYADSWCWIFFSSNRPDDPTDPDTVRKEIYDRITANLLSDVAADARAMTH